MGWTKKDQAKLREYQTAQMTVSEIAGKMGKPAEWIRAELDAMGYKPIESKPEPESEFLKGFEPMEIPKRRTKITPETEKKICELREQCFSFGQIAYKVGLSSATVRAVLIRNGYPTDKGKYHKDPETITEAKEDKPVKLTKVNKDFEAAVQNMTAEAKEEEPAPSANDASSQVENEVLPIINDNISEPVCQGSGINAAVMATLLFTMLDEAYGRECEPSGIKADREHLDLSFSYEGKEYYIVFGQARHYEYDVSGGERV